MQGSHPILIQSFTVIASALNFSALNLTHEKSLDCAHKKDAARERYKKA